jgi:hypothetical protein
MPSAAIHMTRHFILGIDPGERGAAALLRCGGSARPRLEGMCDAIDLAKLLPLAARAELVITESQAASPGMGVVSALSLGRAAGRLQGALEAFLGHRGRMIAPARWKASYGLAGGKVGKVDGLALARELLRPGADACDRLERHDQADAILIAWWGWRNVLAPGGQGVQAAKARHPRG